MSDLIILINLVALSLESGALNEQFPRCKSLLLEAPESDTHCID